jgi:uncharacterized protein YutD
MDVIYLVKQDITDFFNYGCTIIVLTKLRQKWFCLHDVSAYVCTPIAQYDTYEVKHMIESSANTSSSI